MYCIFTGVGVKTPCPVHVEYSIQPDKQDREFKCQPFVFALG